MLLDVETEANEIFSLFVRISLHPAMQNVKLVLVGDGCVGQTALISYLSSIPDGYIATVFDDYTGTLMMDDKTFCLDIRDTAGAVRSIYRGIE